MHCTSTTARICTEWICASPVHQQIGIGYVQPPDGPLVELQVVTAREAFGDNDLPRTTSIRFGDLTAAVDIKGHAPVLLTAATAGCSHFPRAWATVTTDDGRTGVGWVEWNRNQR